MHYGRVPISPTWKHQGCAKNDVSSAPAPPGEHRDCSTEASLGMKSIIIDKCHAAGTAFPVLHTRGLKPNKDNDKSFKQENSVRTLGPSLCCLRALLVPLPVLVDHESSENTCMTLSHGPICHKACGHCNTRAGTEQPWECSSQTAAECLTAPKIQAS